MAPSCVCAFELRDREAEAKADPLVQNPAENCELPWKLSPLDQSDKLSTCRDGVAQIIEVSIYFSQHYRKLFGTNK